MRIAIPYYMGQVFQHFGRAPQFKVYEVENHQVVMEMVVESEAGGHTAVAELLRGLDARVVVCGNIGKEAMRALSEAGIVFYGGVTGEADAAIESLVQGGLAYDPAIRYEPEQNCNCSDSGCGDCSDCSDCAGCGF